MVRFFTRSRQIGTADRGGSYKIIRLLPETANIPHYRVQGAVDGHEPVVREDQLR